MNGHLNSAHANSSYNGDPVRYNTIDQTKLGEILLIVDLAYPARFNYRNYCVLSCRNAWSCAWWIGAGGPEFANQTSYQRPPWGGFPHNDMANVLFCDFHVGQIAWQDEPGYGGVGDGFRMW